MNQSTSPARKPAMQFWAPMGANGEPNPAGEFGRITPAEARDAGRQAARNLMKQRRCTVEEAGDAAGIKRSSHGGCSRPTADTARFHMLRTPSGTTREQVEAGARAAARRLMRTV